MEEKETLLDVQHSPLFKLKRKVLIMALFFNYFLVGLEYSMTIPADYFNEKYSLPDKTFLLLEVGLYPFAAMVSSLILGHVYDRTKKIRTHLIVLNFLQAVGNYIYAINYSRWLPLIGRIVSGAGDGFIALSIAEITYLYEEHNRVGMLCILELGRILGFAMGPIVSFLLIEYNTRHNWNFESKILPAYLMGCCWVAMLVITVCCVHNLALEVIEKFNLNDSPFLAQKTLIYNEQRGRYESADYDTDDDDPDSDAVEEDEAIYSEPENPFMEPDYEDVYVCQEILDPQLGDEVNAEIDITEKECLITKKGADETDADRKDEYETAADKIFPLPEKKKKKTIGEMLRHYARTRMENIKTRMSDSASEAMHRSHLGEILHLEFALLMVVNFVFSYTQTTFVMFGSYITTFEYKWNHFEIGLTYVIGFVMIIIVFLVMYFLRATVLRKNIYFLIVAMALLQISLALVIYEKVPKEVSKRTIVLIVAGVVLFASIPFSLVCFKTLLTSLVRPGLQGTLQGIASAIVRLAMISGLLLSTVTVHDRQVYGAIMTAMCFITIILFFLTFDNITRKQKESTLKQFY